MKVSKKESEPTLKVQPVPQESVVLEANEQLELPSQEEEEQQDECQSKSLANNVGNMS